MFQPINIALDNFDRMWVTDFGTDSVKVYDVSGEGDPEFILSFGHNGKNLDQFNFSEKTRSFPDIMLLDNDGVEVVDEISVVVDAENIETTFEFALANKYLVGTEISITDGVEVFTYDSEGVLSGDKGGSGTYNKLNGNISLTFNTAPVTNILSTYEHLNGNKMLISDSFNHAVKIYNMDCMYEGVIGGFGVDNGKFNCPAGMALSADGSQIHIVDKFNHRVQVFNASTLAFIQSYGSLGHSSTSGLYNPTDIVSVGSDMLVSDTDNNRVVKFTENGSNVWVENATYVVKEFTEDNDSKVIGVVGIVANTGVSGIHLTDTYASILTNFTDAWVAGTDTATKGTVSGKVKNPFGMCLQGTGHLIVADTGNFRLQYLALS